jgi:hypothetical protein
MGKGFNAMIAEDRARAYKQMNEIDQAVVQQKLATSLTPENPARWAALAELYDARGEASSSMQARERAQSIQDAAKDPSKSPEPGSSR